MNQHEYGTIEQLEDGIKHDEERQRGAEFTVLDGVMLLSGIISGIFFWSNSQQVFSIVPIEFVRIILALLVGLAPAEGAFFAWKAIRSNRVDLTEKQLKATKQGSISAIFASVFSTIAMLVISTEYTPPSIAQYTTWVVFIAMTFPITAQIVIYSLFSINERSTVKNFALAQLKATSFDTYIKTEKLRQQAVIAGLQKRLGQTIGAYGSQIGAEEADNLLDKGSDASINLGRGLGSSAPTVQVQDQQIRKYWLEQFFEGMWQRNVSSSSWRGVMEIAKDSIHDWRIVDSNGKILLTKEEAQRRSANGVTRHNANLT